ncbi:MAG: WYL domain-containing protein [Armatimonadetes bacterium]|nr:WYL domain-containing protein [Armatimonadota bacterium]
MRQGDLDRLTAILGTYPADLLQALSRGAPGDGLAQALLDEPRVAEALNRVAEPEREFLAFMARLGGEVSPGAADWWLHHRNITDPSALVERLAAQGLLFYVAAGGPVQPGGEGPAPEARGLHIAGKLWVPVPIGNRAVAQCPVQPLQGVESPPGLGGSDPWRIVRELFIVARHLGERKPHLPRASRGDAGPELAGLAESLGEEATTDGGMRLRWLVALAAQAGIAEETEGRLGVAPNAAGFFERTPLDQRRALVDAAVALQAWNELDPPLASGLGMSAAVAPGRSDVPSAGNRIRARRHVLRVLGEVAQPGRWHRLSEFGERAMEAGPDFLVRRPPPPREGHEPVYRGIAAAADGGFAPVSTRKDWVRVEGAFITEFLSGPLQWVGLLDVVTQSDEVLFRLTDMGARVLGLAEDQDDVRPPGRFFVQPNFEIAADGGGENIGAITRLARVADLTSFDRAALLTVTRESVLRALDGGLSREEILRLLSDEGRVAVPQNVEYSVREWAAAYDRYELRTNVHVLEADEAPELDALEADLPGCFERLSPNAARVLPDKAHLIEKALAQRPDVVAIDHAEGMARLFDLDEQMVARPVPERWHWYAEHWLAQIGERQEVRSQESGVRRTANGDGTAVFRLTRESVHEGLARGLQATEIERFVEACATKDLSPQQRLLLRGWLRSYPPAQMASVTVLALPPEAVGDVTAVPEVREQITGWLSPAIFTVRPQGRAKVKRLLERAGIVVEGELRARGLGDGGPHPRPLTVPERGERHGVWGRRQWRVGEPEGVRLALIEEAIEGGLRIEIEYQSIVKGEAPKRWLVGPRSIERSRWGQVRLHAFCHERESQRVFDVERMTEVQVLEAGV